MSIRLSETTLAEIDGKVAVPTYDRSKLSAGILHFGVGNFHRAHQAVYLDALFETGKGHDFAIVGAGVMPSDQAMRDKLSAQDFLTTVVEQDNARTSARVTGPMVDILPVADAAAIIAKLADPAIKIVSLTVTEGGYFIDSDGVFDPSHPAIAADGQNPDAPKTVFGLIGAGLKRRREAGIAPFTVMSCDNIPHNGKVCRAAVVGTARLYDGEFADWIAGRVAFPNGMVDRITPATSAREIDHCRESFGIDDAWPVYCEEFKQWVLEDHFPAGRPALEEVGVQFVPDVTPYENMKIRILNGGHAIIAYPAGLMDVHFVHEAMETDLVAKFLDKLETEEILPILPPVPNTDLADYYALIKRRFANPKIGDTVRRLCLDGSNRQPKFIVPSILDNLKAGKEPVGLALESALWCRYCRGVTESGATIAPNDPNWDALVERAKAAESDPMAWLEMTEVYGTLKDEPRFAKPFADWLAMLADKGTEATLKTYLGAA
ncbi:mannitol dehydrogenase family protein [Jiella sp. MQZ9-1]|uniref:Mannitol dehydrogenase family protein n=1 Tax=Jiella flava TaxID=2816857 RepID=A0A939FT59_9HYPH|nr:mannitol dehydrogenase family protein [Jiella flava]MBO0661092.1 mannitol dehydrogenase family protein [Jiella flava]MCD2469739.1 mannitol dehydrogenase family protein [Jiella flava]